VIVRLEAWCDFETDDEHPWEFLAEKLREHGVDVSQEELKRIPYEVVSSDRLRARVGSS